MAQKDTEYEQFVRDICQHLLHADGLHTVQALHDVNLTGRSGQAHQVDVYWEYRRAGVLHRVAIECKNYKKAISVGVVRNLQGVLQDIPNLQGVVVTTVGFQAGALKYAESYGIGLRIIRPPVDKDWDGRIRTIKLDMTGISPKVLEVSPEYDPEWLERHLTAEQRAALMQLGTVRVTRATPYHFTDHAAGTSPVQLLDHLNHLIHSLPLDHLTNGETATEVFSYEDATVSFSGFPPLKVRAYHIRYQRHELTESLELESAVQAIVRDAFQGTLQFVDQDGQISGDREVQDEP